LAAFTVEIAAPEVDPYTTLPGDETQFVAIAYLDGEECGESEVSFLWDFGDLATSSENPASHAYAAIGNYTVTVTATLSGYQAQDSLEMQIEADTQATPGYTLELEPSDGTICDAWTLKLTAPGLPPCVAVNVVETRHRHNGGAWILNQHADLTGVSPTFENGNRVFRGPWLTWPCPNLSCQVYCKLSWVGMGAMPPPSGYAYTNILKATPRNTVVKANADLDGGQLIFYDPECTDASLSQPKIEWDAIHRQWPTGLPNQHFDWTTNILDLGGGTMKALQGLQQNPGSGDTTWDGSRTPPAGNAGLGIYSFQVTHTHAYGTHPGCSIYGECGPQSDKPGALTIDQVDVPTGTVQFDVRTATLEFDLTYQLNRIAGDCNVTLFAVDAVARAANPGGNPFQSLGTRALSIAAGPHTKHLEWTLPVPIPCWYWVVVQGRESTADGGAQRDRLAKPAIPKGRFLSFKPDAYCARGGGGWQATSEGCTGRAQQWLTQEGPRQPPPTPPDPPSAFPPPGYAAHCEFASPPERPFERLRDYIGGDPNQPNPKEDAVFFYMGHGGPNVLYCWDWGEVGHSHGWLWGGAFAGMPLWPNDRVIENLEGPALGRCALAMALACESAAKLYGDFGPSVLSALANEGADCAMGWVDVIEVPSARAYSDAFWTAICRDHKSIDDAHADGLAAAGWPGFCGSMDTAVILGDSAQVLRPAHWSE
jgi:PKD repeat protein